MTRIAKVIADAGYCSRREAERLIEQGLVQVNGVLTFNPATLITDQSIKINNKLLKRENEIRVFLFHKPAGIITTNADPQGRKTVFDLLSKNLPRLISVGRLDFNTEGLMILTTSGAVARHIELPKNKWIRKYRARVFGKIELSRLKKLEKGITIDGVRYKGIKAEVDHESSNSWLTISITEGKNREIRKIMEHLNLKVNRLIRTSFGPFILGDLKSSQIIEVNKKNLKNFLGDLVK
jgi:23S rRNA pseudouridine2605 synthase